MQPVINSDFGAGLSQKGVRNYNERLLLSLLQRYGDLPGSDLARLAELSPPAVSGILKRLENDGLLLRGTPQRGRVGKPSSPMRINPDGAFSLGLKIGRRSADLVLLDMIGGIRHQEKLTYRYADPHDIRDFLRDGYGHILQRLSPEQVPRICGVGIAAPFDMWHWPELQDDPPADFAEWAGVDMIATVRDVTGLPVLLLNDATAACQAEQIFGRGKEFGDYAYFFVGAFVGGGVVLNHSLFEGRRGNAGALGSLRTVDAAGNTRQLVDTASMHLLEARLRAGGLDPALLWRSPGDWSAIRAHVGPWLKQTAQELARASLSACAVIDFEAILIDGFFPDDIRSELVAQVRRFAADQDTRGLLPPRIETGQIGSNARAIGAASSPMFTQFFLNTNAGRAPA